jgi:hypothetical protein
MVVVASAKALWRLYRRLMPRLTTVFEMALALRGEQRQEYLQSAYDRLPRADFCRDVLGRARGATRFAVFTWAHEIGWTDLGTPARMRAWLAATAAVPQSEGPSHGMSPIV